MKYLILFWVINNSYAATGPKIYTEAEFRQKLNDELAKKISMFKDEALTTYLNELLKKEKNLELRENKLKEKQAQINISDQNFEKRVKIHLTKQNELIGCLDSIKDDEDKRISRMVEIISTMKPDKAAQVLSIQDQELTIKILGLLDPKFVSKIFNLMDKEISARLQKQFMTMKR